MFGLFSKKDPNRCPVTEENRLWIESSFSLLVDLFGKENIMNRAVLVPHHSHFPIQYNGEDKTAIDTLKILAKQMEVEFDDIALNFYHEGLTELATGSPLNGARIFLNSAPDDKNSAGLYFGKEEDGKYHIAMERRKLKQPENMVATLSHEIAHIKLLGETRIEDNDEKLTDFTTVIFGLGIFNANAAFQTFRTIDSSGWRKMGYLSQMEWGYALALFAHIRGEKTPDWIEWLSLNVKGDFKQGERFIENYPELLFKT
ncbi:MAG: hypothetical protein ABI402_06160 [Ferruginibacter sp.]